MVRLWNLTADPSGFENPKGLGRQNVHATPDHQTLCSPRPARDGVTPALDRTVERGDLSQAHPGFTITPQASGETLLTGLVADQAALHGLLNKIRDIGLLLLSVQREESEESSRDKSSKAGGNAGRTEIPHEE